ncbi:MarR family winged helix-turn-helix transcriptional regulator [Polycladidibacter hongkongensis]|uniref:MarR family winged helix-turn-helix transcriptional regulator n=1 Tax=Polycladidibacter hongkongensis TaxID=1647556 RepID=UPI000A91C395|nr:MarR family transcriptional regulator [Pseudovibrio hongkongensis]
MQRNSGMQPMKSIAMTRELIDEVVELYTYLSRVSAQLVADHQMTAYMRALLLFIAEHEPVSVPQIAKRKHVTRQNVQVPVNGLIQLGYLNTQSNPENKRSPLLSLSEMGLRVSAEIDAKEAALIAPLVHSLGEPRLKQSAQTLRQMRRALAQLIDPDSL